MTADPIEEFATETVPTRTRVELDEQQISDMGLLGPALLSGPANVIMQLSHPAVGYGVYESKVDSGNLYKHPVKRTRTTLTYLAVAATGGGELRRKYRQAVNRSHAQVRSVESSPVKYNAFDPSLQLWVAACLYRGWEDCVRIFGDEADLTEEAYRQGAVMGTTLQMPPEMWPATRADFEDYWNSVLDDMVIDDVIGSYLKSLVRLEFAPAALRVLAGRFSEIMTIGFLPPEFRDKIGFTQSKRDKLLFDVNTRALRALVQTLPQSWRQFPFNVLLADLKWRMRTNRPLI
ncbi:oxygenase MpaB family protein [Gordonia sp. HY442]|uniref:oxygenase MpaB family protein n=1 Tax=Gordonia zhenghanii TaxID=2911516 RepID=UPI001F41839C|nr:oxygenase MpaB family protein [Gordonia zhenghanii]MCF8604452.1 oxygenase MpaB family protein [Gordonia zhenghanii]